MKTLRKMDLDSMEREMKVLQNPEKYLGGSTFEEYEAMCDNGTWSGGYVDGIYCFPQVTITGSATTCYGDTCVTYMRHEEALAYVRSMIAMYSNIGDISTVGSFFDFTGFFTSSMGTISMLERKKWEDMENQLNNSNAGLRVISYTYDNLGMPVYNEYPSLYYY